MTTARATGASGTTDAGGVADATGTADAAEGAERAHLAAALTEARDRTLGLLAPLDERALTVQHSPLMSPLVWDLAHIGNYEDQWLVRALGAPGVAPELDDMYDAFRHPRPNRPQLPLLPPAEARAYIGEVRARALDVLARLDLDSLDPVGTDLDGPDRLRAGGFVHRMVIQHEHQHDETILATLQLMDSPGYRPDAPFGPGAVDDRDAQPTGQHEVVIPAGSYTVGTSDDSWAYDNERPAHLVDLAAYAIETLPVTNDAFAAFIADGGYDDERLWSQEGWEWRNKADLQHPEFWQRDGGRGDGWVRDRFGFVEPVPPDEPVQHVCWFEADAFARWTGCRLPTEQEWEVAASLGAVRGRGRVWEWTSSDFGPYPGFVAFPYREYSEVFFGSGYKVLRGGSWATHPTMARPTFRNWDWPIRRQIFTGFRCARDA